MKILLIAPATGNWKGIAKKKFFNGKTFRFSMLPLLTVAGLTPSEHEVTIVDEQIGTIPLKKKFDLVAITAMTALAPRAYEIAQFYRGIGVPVVMGGFHATLNPIEALRHVDSIVSGPAYGAWQELLSDLKRGYLKKVYYGKIEGNIPVCLPREKLDAKEYLTVNATFATLGCANACLFCSVNEFYGMKRYKRDISDVIAEIKSFRNKFFIFIDDNLAQDKLYALRLCKALIPLKKKWVTQVSVDVSDDDELLNLMQKAGCIGIFVGLESFSKDALESQDKSLKSPFYYKEAINKIHGHGLFVESGLIVGFDTDDKRVFSDTLRMLDDIGIDLIQLSILTPLPGTELYSTMRHRIIEYGYEHYDFRHAVFEPKLMTAVELQGGADWLIRKFYSPFRIMKRIFRWVLMKNGILNMIYPLVLNIAYYGRIRQFNISGTDPCINKKVELIEKKKVRHPLLAKT